MLQSVSEQALLYALYVLGAAAATGIIYLFFGPATGVLVGLFYVEVGATLARTRHHLTANTPDGRLLLLWGRAVDVVVLLMGMLMMYQMLLVPNSKCFSSSSSKHKRRAHSSSFPAKEVQSVTAPAAGPVSKPGAPGGHVANEPWGRLPDAVMDSILDVVMLQSGTADVKAIRSTCSEWLDTSRRIASSLKPVHFDAHGIVRSFPNVKKLDLALCTQEVSPSGLQQLTALKELSELSLGCCHRLIASSITDRCMLELLMLSKLQTLNLSQCVHVGDAGMMSLAFMPQLTSLNVSGCMAITDVGMVMISQMTNLRVLEMPWCMKVTDEGIRALAGLSRLTSLNICGCQLITEAGVGELGVFLRLEKLNMLNLGQKMCVTDAALAKLKHLSCLSNLSFGGMQTNTKVMDDSLALIASSFPKLSHLTLIALDVSDVGVAKLTALTGLEALNLRVCNQVTRASLLHLATMTALTELCLLHNNSMAVTADGVRHISGLPRMSNLLLDNLSPEDGGSALLAVTQLKGLNALSLAGYSGALDEPACAALATLTGLVHLDLSAAKHVSAQVLSAVSGMKLLLSLQLNRCTGLDATALAHVAGFWSLHTLNLTECSGVSSSGLGEAVGRVPTLTNLVMARCTQLEDEGLRLLAPLGKLKSLDLSDCIKVTGTGFDAFRGMSSIHHINLKGCSSLCDAGLRSIGKLVSISKLDLPKCTNITSTGVAYLRNLKALTGLDLTECSKTGDAALAVLAALPSLTILKLSGCSQLSDRGVEQLAKVTGLLTVHLDWCTRLTDASLVQLGRLTSLTGLRLACCRELTDAGVAELSSLSRLSMLSLAGCPNVTQVGLMALHSLTTLARLEF